MLNKQYGFNILTTKCNLLTLHCVYEIINATSIINQAIRNRAL